MRLERIIEAVYSKPWCITPAKHKAIRAALDAHLAGISFPDFEDGDDDNDCGYEVVGSVAIIDIAGVILNKCSGLEAACGAFSLECFKQDLKTVAALDTVKSIVLNISSGGGIITGVPEAADLITEVARTKDVYAYTDDCIASAAYWLASQANNIFISKSAEIGSIGVYCYLIDSSAAYQQAGLKPELFKAGKYKGTGLDGMTLSDDAKAMLQAGVDKAYAQFTGYVTAKRKGIAPETMQGQMFDSEEAQANGLIDGIINSLDDLINHLNAK